MGYMLLFQKKKKGIGLYVLMGQEREEEEELIGQERRRRRLGAEVGVC